MDQSASCSEARAYLEAARSAMQGLSADALEPAVELCWKALSSGGKLLLCGNGGSAADAQHLAAELVARFRLERKALSAVALTSDNAVITAMANDYHYSRVFARQVEALGRPGDVLVAISTSGSSPNVLEAAEAARARGLRVLGLTGSHPEGLEERCDVLITAPSAETSHAQECLMVLGQALCHCLELRAEQLV